MWIPQGLISTCKFLCCCVVVHFLSVVDFIIVVYILLWKYWPLLLLPPAWCGARVGPRPALTFVAPPFRLYFHRLARTEFEKAPCGRKYYGPTKCPCATTSCPRLVDCLQAQRSQMIVGVGNRVLVYDALDGDLQHSLKGHRTPCTRLPTVPMASDLPLGTALGLSLYGKALPRRVSWSTPTSGVSSTSRTTPWPTRWPRARRATLGYGPRSRKTLKSTASSPVYAAAPGRTTGHTWPLATSTGRYRSTTRTARRRTPLNGPLGHLFGACSGSPQDDQPYDVLPSAAGTKRFPFTKYPAPRSRRTGRSAWPLLSSTVGTAVPDHRRERPQNVALDQGGHSSENAERAQGLGMVHRRQAEP